MVLSPWFPAPLECLASSFSRMPTVDPSILKPSSLTYSTKPDSIATLIGRKRSNLGIQQGRNFLQAV
jgi:hypothetical protein